MPKIACALAPLAAAASLHAQDATNVDLAPTNESAQSWNFHVLNTDIVQGYPAYSAKYSGPNSLPPGGEIRETLDLDLFAGVRLWPGAEAHIDCLTWQGFGIGNTIGAEGFPNGEAFKLGTALPNVNLARLFLRQTIPLGPGEDESVESDALTLAGKLPVSRLTLTLGKMSAKDIFDNNTYANDPATQFMNWGLMANEAWDYPGDVLGFTTGFAAELNQPAWALRYGFFQMPRVSNGAAWDHHYLEAWAMAAEFERRFSLGAHPGAVRLLAFLNRAHMGSYGEAAAENVNIVSTRAYRSKYGFGLNFEQEIVKNIGFFSRLGWSDGHNEAWVFSDVDRTATAGFSLKGGFWSRPADTVGIAGVVDGASTVHQRFLAGGGTGILAGDGALSYGWEKDLEAYYDIAFCAHVHGSVDYQLITDPAFNRDRGPISVFGARLHAEFCRIFVLAKPLRCRNFKAQ